MSEPTRASSRMRVLATMAVLGGMRLPTRFTKVRPTTRCPHCGSRCGGATCQRCKRETTASISMDG